MAVPPRDPWRERYRPYYSRLYTGWGCLYTILLFLLFYWLLSLIFSPLVFW